MLFADGKTKTEIGKFDFLNHKLCTFFDKIFKTVGFEQSYTALPLCSQCSMLNYGHFAI